MKKVHSVIFLSFLIILLLVTPVNGSSDDWVEYGRDNSGDVYSYNKVKIKHRTKDIVQVWTKCFFSDEGREKYIQYRMNKGSSLTERWDKLSYRLSLVEIDCKKGMFQFLSIFSYDMEDNVLESYLSDKPDWDYIVPGSFNEILQKIVCK